MRLKTVAFSQVRKGDSQIYSFGKAGDQLMWRGDMIAYAWETLFGPAGFGPIPEKVRCSFTAEFFVPREAIRAHPREFYLKAIQWILDTEKMTDMGDYAVAVMFENIWHVIFGADAVMEKLPVESCELYECDDAMNLDGT